MTDNQYIRIIPIGGLEGIGLNMTVFETKDSLIIVDAGLMFPQEDMPGVDFIIPDFSYILENIHKLNAIIITHGHEDHIGSIPFLLKKLKAKNKNIPIYSSPLTLAFINKKLQEYKIKHQQLIKVKPRDCVQVGNFEIEFIRVTHSIADGFGLAIKSPSGIIIHTGDFKIDPTPVDGQLMDLNRFSQYGDKGVLLMLSDSTNSDDEGFTLSERQVRKAFEDIFTNVKGRIIITTFASNIHRIQQAIDVAVNYDRYIFMCGKSVVSNVQIAIELGYLKIPLKKLLKIDDLKDIKDIPDNKIAVITTGSQGEPMSVLSRISTNKHKHIKIKEGDTVVLSSRIISGNERSINKIVNNLMKQGADVRYEQVSDIHVSGHGSKEELKLMLNIVSPKYFMPIHGEYRHLKYHSELALKLGIPKDNIFILENGDVLEVTDKGISVKTKITSGRIFIDTGGRESIEDALIKDRKILAYSGIVIIFIGLQKDNRKIISGPEIISKGFITEDSFKSVIDGIKNLIINSLSNLKNDSLSNINYVESKMKSTVKKYLKDKFNKKPIILFKIIGV